MKKGLFCLTVLLGLSFPALGGSISVDNFGGGLNTQDSPLNIESSQAQSLLNVNFTPGGSAVYKRDGYGLFQNLPINTSTTSVHGGYHFQQLSGNDVQLWANDTELSASVSDGTFVKIATGTVGATWQCADSQGFAYCFSSLNDTPVKTDGTTSNTTYQPAISSGTMAVFTPNQLVVAGVPGSQNTLFVSGQNNFLNFAIGTLPSSPFQEVIVAPGSRITHIAYYFGKLFWWKDQSFGYMIFTTQNDVQVVTISNQIGTIDNSDAFWNSSGYDAGSKITQAQSATAYKTPGGIYFRGQDNHLYVYDGYYLTRISRIITPSITSTNRRKLSSWTQSLNSDFGNGSGYVTFTDTTTVLNTIQLSGASGNFVCVSGACPWTQLSKLVDFIPGNIAVINANDGAPSFASIMSTNTYHFGENWDVAGNIQFSQSISNGEQDYFGLVNVSTQGYYISAYPINSSTMGLQCGKITGPDTYTSPVVVTGVTTAAVIELQHGANGTINCLANGVVQGSFTDTTLTKMTNVYVGFYSDIPSAHRTAANSYAAFTSTGIYYSAVNNAPNITSWNILNVQDNQGTTPTITYYVRTATNSFTVTQATGPQTSANTTDWVLQTKNTQITASTGTYMQLRSNFSIDVATEAPQITSFGFYWYEGTAADKSYMQYFNDAIWFSVSLGTSTSTNNRIFYWDLLNGAWSLYDIAANGFLVENSTLYLGDPVRGRIFRYGNVSTDNGSTINSYWRSKSFLSGGVVPEDNFVQKEFNQADFLLGETPATLTYTYTLDSSRQTAFSLSGYSSTDSLIQRNFLLPRGKIGKYYDFQLSDNSGSMAWRMMGHRVIYNPLNWRPVLQ